MEMSEYVEFYLTTNPPLLPDGVRSTIAHMQEHVDSAIVEILYEPEVPWFKIIALAGNRGKVLAKIQLHLEQLLEDETAPVDDDLAGGSTSDSSDDEPRADVELVVEKPHIIPWAVYQHQKWADGYEYDTFRFPEPIQALQYKTTWRGLELFDGLMIMDLLLKYDFIHPDPNISLGKIGELTKCHLTHNMKGDLVYIGSNETQGCLKHAVQKLANLLSLHVAIPLGSSHLIFTESKVPPTLSFRYFTHLGLDKITYTNAQISEILVENYPLTEASTLRTNVVDDSGNTKPDTAVYTRNTGAYIFCPSFGPFKKLKYSAKPPGFIATPEPKQPAAGSASQSSGQSQTRVTQTSSMVTPKESWWHKENLSTVSIDLDRDAEDSSIDEDKSAAEDSGVERPTEPNMVRSSPHLIQVLMSDAEGQEDVEAPPLEASMGMNDMVTNWMAGLETATVPRSPQLHSQLGTGESIDYLGDASIMLHSDPCFRDISLTNLAPNFELRDEKLDVQNSEANRPDNRMGLDPTACPFTPKLKPADAERCLLDSDSPPKITYGMFYPMDLALQGQNQNILREFSENRPLTGGEHLMDSSITHIHTPALMDSVIRGSTKTTSTTVIHGLAIEDEGEGQDITPIIQKRMDDEKEFFQTMRQKAGAKKARRRGLITIQGKNTEENSPLGARVVGIKPSPSTEKSPNKRVICETPSAMISEGNKRLVPGMQEQSARPKPDRAVHRPEGLNEVVDNAQNHMKGILGILQLTPGRLRLEARLGRLCIKNLNPSLVNMGTGPSWEASMILDSFDISDGNIGFHTILTTNGSEADLLATMIVSKAKRWTLYQKDVYFDFICQSKEDGDRKVIEVDASTFAYSCRSAAQQLSGLYIHCPKRAWDVQIGVTRFDDDEVPQDFGDFARGLVQSLNVLQETGDQIHFEAEQDTDSGWSIENARIRHIAKYNITPTDQTYLAITMTRAIRGNRAVHSYRGETIPGPIPGEGPMTCWFEASIGSTKADDLFKQNASLEFGDKTSWTPDQLTREGVIKAICKPALQMVTQMDEVGRTNYNEQGLKLVQGRSHGLSEKDTDYVFW